MRYKRLIQRILVLMGLYQLARLVFLAANWAEFGHHTPMELALGFLSGLRFDLSAVLILNAPFVLLWLWPGPRWLSGRQAGRRGAMGVRIAFCLVNTLAVGFCIADAEYFKFVGRRLSLDSFAIAQDIQEQTGQVLLYYWPYTLLTLGAGFCLWKTYGTKPEEPAHEGLLKRSVLSFVLLALTVMGIRGGLQAKPLTVAHAYGMGSHELAQLRLNSTFTLLKSRTTESLERRAYFPGWKELMGVLRTSQAKAETLVKDPAPPWRPNVVLIILESFHLEYMLHGQGPGGYTPFLSELAARGTFYKSCFANGRRSIDALPSVLAGLPALMDEAWITSRYQSAHVKGLPAVLAEEGYDTAFFHGGHDGTMYFDVMARRFGFSKYFGASSYPDQTQDDGRWGIYDEPFLQFASGEMSKLRSPFFATVFTLSSHHPYEIPKSHEGQFPKGTLEIHESIGYADYALKRFFETARKEPWFDNTLFVLTADHTSKSETEEFSNFVGKFRVPLIFFHPNRDPGLPQTDLVTQHTDVPATILALLGLDPGRMGTLFGKPLFRKETPGEALIYGDKSYVLIRDEWAVRMDPEEHLSHHAWREDPALGSPLKSAMAGGKNLDRRLKAYVQYYIDGLMDDRLGPKIREGI